MSGHLHDNGIYWSCQHGGCFQETQPEQTLQHPTPPSRTWRVRWSMHNVKCRRQRTMLTCRRRLSQLLLQDYRGTTCWQSPPNRHTICPVC